MSSTALCAAILAAALFSMSCAATSTGSGSAGGDFARLQEDVRERWGVELLGVRLSAGGYMLDFRYRMIDPEKAATLFDKKTRPYLIDQATGARMAVPNPPKTGPLRTSHPPQPGRTGFFLFANPGKLIKAGGKVTVVIGDLKVENLTVN